VAQPARLGAPARTGRHNPALAWCFPGELAAAARCCPARAADRHHSPAPGRQLHRPAHGDGARSGPAALAQRPANLRRNPNENLSRELLELFSLGEGPKTILGRSAAFDGESLAAWLAQQPATARHITRRLWLQRVGTPPAPERLEALARGWRQQQLSIPWLLQAIDASPEAIASREHGLRLADPLEVVARSRHRDALAISLRGLRAMAQAPFEPPSVKGWPHNALWLHLRWLQARRRGLQALLADEEVWASAQLPAELPASLTPIPPLGLALPAEPTRSNSLSPVCRSRVATGMTIR